jgi:hypothetical protein
MTQQSLVQALVGLIGTGGIGGAIFAFLRWRPEASSAAVVDAQGAASEWKKIAGEYEEQRDYWQQRSITSERREAATLVELEGAKKRTADAERRATDAEERLVAVLADRTRRQPL